MNLLLWWRFHEPAPPSPAAYCLVLSAYCLLHSFYCLLLSAYSFPNLENERSMVNDMLARAIST